MKTLISLLFLIVPLLAGAQSPVITATVGVTNATANGNTIVVNGVSRYATNVIPSFATTFPVGATTTLAASNLFAAYALSPAANLTVSLSGTNVTFYALPNSPNVITFGGNWAVVNYSTNYITNAVAVRVPYNVEGNAQQTNIASGVVAWMSLNANTNVLPANTVAMQNFLPNGGYLGSIGGVYHWTGANIYDGSFGGVYYLYGTMSNQFIYGFQALQGTNATLWNVGTTTSRNTNALFYGNAISSIGSSQFSEQFGSNAIAVGAVTLALGSYASAYVVGDVAVGEAAFASGGGSVAFGNSASVSTNAANAIAIGVSSVASKPEAIAIGDSAIASGTNSMAIGPNVVAASNNQIVLGASSQSLIVPGGIFNTTVNGTNQWNSDQAFQRFNNTSLANGGNAAVNVATNVFVKVSGPSGAFSIAGVAGGRDGRHIIIENATGFTMTISNDSGTDPTAANRIYTGTGSDIVNSSAYGIVQLIYDSSLTHWLVISSH